MTVPAGELIATAVPAGTAVAAFNAITLEHAEAITIDAVAIFEPANRGQTRRTRVENEGVPINHLFVLVGDDLQLLVWLKVVPPAEWIGAS